MAEEEKMMSGNNMMVDSSTGNYTCSYSDEDHHHSTHNQHQHQHQHHDVNSTSIPNATSTFETNPLEIYNFESSHNSVSHNSVDHFWNKGPSPCSKPMITHDSSDFYHQFDDSSLQRCVFTCEPNERPSQGLSLSLSSANPSSIGLQSFELVRPQEHQHYQHQHHQGYSGKSMNTDHHHQMMIQDRFLGKPGNIINSGDGDGEHDDGGGGGSFNNHQSAHYNIRSSRYLVPAQEILGEFCNLGSKQSDDHSLKAKAAATTSNPLQDHGNLNNSSSSKAKSLSSVEFMELQKRRTKLLQMLEEVYFSPFLDHISCFGYIYTHIVFIILL